MVSGMARGDAPRRWRGGGSVGGRRGFGVLGKWLACFGQSAVRRSRRGIAGSTDKLARSAEVETQARATEARGGGKRSAMLYMGDEETVVGGRIAKHADAALGGGSIPTAFWGKGIGGDEGHAHCLVMRPEMGEEARRWCNGELAPDGW